MAFARAHDSRDRVAVRGKALLITASEWRARGCKQQCSNHDGGPDYLPSMTLRPSHTAPTRPVTIMVITALKV